MKVNQDNLSLLKVWIPICIWVMCVAYFGLREGMLGNHELLIQNQKEYDGFITIDSISKTVYRVTYYHVEIKGVGETPTFEIGDLYEEDKVYDLLEPFSKGMSIPVKWIKNGRFFHNEPILTEINHNRDFGHNGGKGIIVLSFIFAFTSLAFFFSGIYAAFFYSK